MMPNVGQAIYRRRTKRGWSQARLARAVECAGATVSHVEAGQRIPYLPMLYRFAEALGCDGSELLREAELITAGEIFAGVGAS